MKIEKLYCWNSLIKSRGGNHISIYLDSEHGIKNLLFQLENSIELAYSFLSEGSREEIVDELLEPILELKRTLPKMKLSSKSLAIFRANGVFEVVELPIEIESTCVVAFNFHVIPLLNWLQKDSEFLIMGLSQEGISLYQGNQTVLKHIDDVLFPESVRTFDLKSSTTTNKDFRNYVKEVDRALGWINTWILELTAEHRPMLFIVGGDDSILHRVKSNINYPTVHSASDFSTFKKDLLTDITNKVRSLLKEENEVEVKHKVESFNFLDLKDLRIECIEQIAKEAHLGNVKKLLITEDSHLFGKFCADQEKLELYDEQLNNMDGCVVDEIARQVITDGGEVIFVEESPDEGPPIYAYTG